MKEIKQDGVVLARHIFTEDIKPGLNFFSEDCDFVQIGAWRYDAGKELLAHVHNEVERIVTRTYEVLYVISGELEATIYNLEEKIVEVVNVKAGELLVLLECGHGYQIIEEDTRVIEVKNGPYLGADIDRYRI